MRIHSIRVSNASNVCKDWEIDFNKGKLRDGYIFLLRGDPESFKTLILESIALAFFGRIHPEEIGFWDEKSSSEVHFETHSGVYSVSWSGVYHCLRDRSGRIISQSPSDVGNTVERLTGLNRQTLSCAIFPPFEDISDFLNGNTLRVDSLLTNKLQANLLPLTKEVIRQKEAFIAASKQVLESLNSPEASDETKNQQELDLLQREISILEKDISKNRRSVDWLDEQTSIREELNKLNQRKSVITAESARFEIKREILNKANRALLIEPLYVELNDIRDKQKEVSKSLSEVVKNSSHLSDRTRVAQKSFDEAERRYKTISEESYVLIAQANKAKLLEKDIRSVNEELKHKQEQLDNQQTTLKNLQDEGTNIKNQIAQLNKKEQVLKKKMDDWSTDAQLVDSYAEFETQLDDIDQKTNLINQCEESRKSIQKQIDQSKTSLLEIQNELSSLKNEELLCHGELSVKEKSLVKIMSFVPLEDIKKEYDHLKEKNTKIAYLLKLNDELAELFEKQTEYRAEQDKGKHELRLATLTLSAANQSLKDKIAIVQTAEEAYKFQELVRSFEADRKNLSNGKPCPLCGAIHHPYQNKLPFDGKIKEQLDQAKRDLVEAQGQAMIAEKLSQDIHIKQQGAERQAKENDELIEKLQQKILNFASSLEITGLREKKSVTWGGIIKQKSTSLASRLEDIKNKIEKIVALSSSIEEFRSQVQSLNQKMLESRARYTALENENKENNVKIQELTRVEKEAFYNRSELILALERSFIRFGIKASTPALLRQNLPILAKRREQWLSSVKEAEDISKQLQADNLKLEQNSSLLTTEKLTAESLEKQCAEFLENLRRLQKELSDITSSQDPDEMISKANIDVMEASNQLNEAKSVLNTRQEALNNNQSLLDELRQKDSDLSAQLKGISEKFLLALQEHNFTNEVSFSASRIPESQRLELQKQNDIFASQINEIDEQIQEKAREFKEHTSLAMTNRARTALEEEYFQMNGQLQKLNTRISRAREVAARYHNSKQRLLREKKEIARLTEEKEIWQKVETELTQNQISANGLVGIGYKLMAEFTQRQLHSLGYEWLVNFKESNRPLFGISEGGQIRLPCYASSLLPKDRLVAEISMSLGLSVIASMGTTPDFLIWKMKFEEVNGIEAKFVECLKKLHSSGKQIGVFSMNHMPKGRDIGYIDLKKESSGILSLQGQN